MRLGKVLIVDASYLLHRTLYAGQLQAYRNDEGEGIGGVFQFINSLYREMMNFPGYYPIICWDHGLSQRRVAVYPNYKHNEEKLIELAELKALGVEPKYDDIRETVDYCEQREKVINILNALGIPSIMFNGWEGDDIVYIVSKLTNNGIVMSDDRDYIQMLSPNIKVYRPMVKDKSKKLLVYNEYQAKHNDPDLKKFVFAKAIAGDRSDNIPSCAPRVGEKTAEKIAELMVDHRDTWKDEIASMEKGAAKNFLTEESLAQFEVNLELIDLSRIDVTDEIVKQISLAIENGLHIPDYFHTLSIIAGYGIYGLQLDGMVALLNNLITEGRIFDE